jgi:hypothetical protein
MLRRATFVSTDVSEEHIASIIRVTRSGQLGTTLAVTSNRRTMRRNTTADNVVLRSPILVTLMRMKYVPAKHRFLQEPHGVTFQKTAFCIVIALKTSNIT